MKAIVETASLTANTDMLAEYTARNNTALKELTEKHGVELRRLPDDVLAEIRKISEQKTAELVSEDELSQRIFDSWTKYRDNVVQYHEISERAYINARAR